MRNISVYPISKKEVEDCLKHHIQLEERQQSVGSIDLVCLSIALQIVQASNFKGYPSAPVEFA